MKRGAAGVLVVIVLGLVAYAVGLRQTGTTGPPSSTHGPPTTVPSSVVAQSMQRFTIDGLTFERPAAWLTYPGPAGSNIVAVLSAEPLAESCLSDSRCLGGYHRLFQPVIVTVRRAGETTTPPDASPTSVGWSRERSVAIYYESDQTNRVIAQEIAVDWGVGPFLITGVAGTSDGQAELRQLGATIGLR